MVALRKESVDRNTDTISDYLRANRSLSARRAWIEIWAWGRRGTAAGVALRKESVDRNHAVGADHHKRRVALRKESVDRNAHAVNLLGKMSRSLSARRAWIEIGKKGT